MESHSRVIDVAARCCFAYDACSASLYRAICLSTLPYAKAEKATIRVDANPSIPRQASHPIVCIPSFVHVLILLLLRVKLAGHIFPPSLPSLALPLFAFRCPSVVSSSLTVLCWKDPAVHQSCRAPGSSTLRRALPQDVRG